MKNKTEEWNLNNLLSEEKINAVIENFGHFTFKPSNSNSISGGLIAEKVDLEGYVCMSSVMQGTEYDLMNNPSAHAKVYKRINAVIEGTEQILFDNVNTNDVLYIKKVLVEINKTQSLNLEVSNKRLKQVIIQDKNESNKLENKELIILRSSGFGKILAKALQKEKEAQSENNNFYTRKKAQMTFGGANPINIGVNGYLMSNVLYFDCPSDNIDVNFNEAYRIHHSGIKLYDLVNVDFLKKYLEYQIQIGNKSKINNYWIEKEKELIESLFNYMKGAVNKKYQLLIQHKNSFPNKQAFSATVLKSGNEDKLLALVLINKNVSNDADEKFINCLVAILKSKTFYVEKEKINLVLSDTNVLNIKRTLRNLLWQNI